MSYSHFTLSPSPSPSLPLPLVPPSFSAPSKDESLIKEKEMALAEMRDNDLTQARQFGFPCHYGDVIQLWHPYVLAPHAPTLPLPSGSGPSDLGSCTETAGSCCNRQYSQTW